MFKDLSQGAIAVAVFAVGAAIAYFFYQKAQAQQATAQSVALNNQAFQQQIQTQELDSLITTTNSGSASTNIGGIQSTGTGAATGS